MDSTSLRKNGPIGQGASNGVDSENSPGLTNTTARSAPAHNDAVNVQTKETSSHKPYGELGGRGMGGAC